MNFLPVIRCLRRRRHSPGNHLPHSVSGAVAAMVLSLFVLSACETGLETGTNEASPRVYLRFVEPVLLQDGEASKRSGLRETAADLTTQLIVTASSGEDFSPDPFTVSDTEGETTLTLSLPAGDLYTISVSFLQGATEVATGSVLYYISRDTKEIEIPIIPFSPGSALVGFLPGMVRIDSEADAVLDIDLRYFTGGTPIVGLACLIDVEGIDAASLSFDGAELSRSGESRLALTWSWSTPLSSDTKLGTLSIPLSSAASLRLQIVEGNARSVTSSGAITRLEAVGASVEIIP